MEFQTPEELFEYIDENCVTCMKCGHIISMDISNEMGIDPLTGRDYYICDDCME